MKSGRFWTSIASLTALVLIGALLRLIPHPPNFSPIAALALFAGAHFPNRAVALLIPMAAMFLSDLILGFHATMWAVYLAFGLVVFLGYFIRDHKSTTRIGVTSVVGSLVFFAITNFAVWMSGMYPQTGEGLRDCYLAAIPYLDNSIFGDLLFTGVFFSAWTLVEKRVLGRQPADKI